MTSHVIRTMIFWDEDFYPKFTNEKIKVLKAKIVLYEKTEG